MKRLSMLLVVATFMLPVFTAACMSNSSPAKVKRLWKREPLPQPCCFGIEFRYGRKTPNLLMAAIQLERDFFRGRNVSCRYG